MPGRGAGAAHPSPRRRLRDAGDRRIRGRRHRGRHSGHRPGRRRRARRLLVDIGTNGEIVLAADGKLTAASTAAGPAFEGARISCGMRGSTGRDREGGRRRPPADQRDRRRAAGGALRLGPDRRGGGTAPPRPADAAGPAANARPTARRRARPTWPGGSSCTTGRSAFLLAAEAETADGRPIVLTQRDLRELQLATGAIRAGIAILLRRAGLRAEGPASGC